MGIHTNILDALASFGYCENFDGVCHGFSLRWLEASILGQENVFDERIQNITSNGPELAKLFHKAEQGRWKNLTEEEKRELFDIRAFSESLALFQDSGGFSSIFDAYITQVAIETTSTLASSQGIRALGGLAQIYSEPSIYTPWELGKYLTDLGLIFESYQSQEAIGVLLSNWNHAIALSYTPGTGWKFMDVNHYPSLSFKQNQTSSLAGLIELGFEGASADYYIPLNTTVLTTGKNPRLEQLKAELGKFKASHVVTEELATRKVKHVGLAFIAARHGHVNVIAELAKHDGVDLNQAINSGETPAYIAAHNGHANVIAELARHDGVDLNKAKNDGATPAFIAAQQGHANVIAELAKHDGVDLNKARNGGATPAFIAAQQGHANVITELAKHNGVDLNKANDGGETPALAAAKKGHANVITELAVVTKNEQVIQLMQQARKIELLFHHINALRLYGDKMSQQKAGKSKLEGTKAVNLADGLDRSVMSYILALTAQPSDNESSSNAKREFNQLLESGCQDMRHRAIWKPFLVNILIAAAGIGLLLIVRKYLTTGDAFFSQPERRKKISDVNNALVEFERDCIAPKK